MKCLVCKGSELEIKEVAPGLRTHNCSNCGGNWLRFEDYAHWRNNNTLEVESCDSENAYLPVNDSTNPKLCPDCGRILSVYKVSSSLSFKLEHCAVCNGIWFDKNEWENLKVKHLHNQIHKLFTDSWQNNLRFEERKEYFIKFYARKFGAEDYAKIKEIREWLNSKENKSMLLAYLMNNDPYKI